MNSILDSECQHDFVWSTFLYLTDPPTRAGICRKCLLETTVREPLARFTEYDRLKRQKNRQTLYDEFAKVRQDIIREGKVAGYIT